ncbi:MAG TPA: ABC transporter permease [Solirubrobacter sp.]|nr:ABC transporter permease [Solirubrobacter sp.]
MNSVRLVARREFTQRARERSFLVSTGLTLAIVLLVVALPTLLGIGGPSEYTVAATDPAGRAVAERAAELDERFDADATVKDAPPADVTLSGGTIHADEQPDDKLVNLLQVANQQLDADAQPPLNLVTAEPVDPDRDAKAGLAFFAIMILYGQIIAYGYWVAAGVVEEKASRVIEVLLATIRPRQLLAGKVIGLGLLGLGQLLGIAALGLAVAGVSGALDIDAGMIGAVALSVVWFLLGYAFYASAFAVAGALVPRQEELQSSTTPLTMLILVSFFAGLGVNADPDGTLAHVCAFIPTTAPITMPGRIILGAVPAWEIAASVAVTVLATLALIPLAGRIYSAVVLRTGTAVKLREALSLARR